jgi:hypothetical protein
MTSWKCSCCGEFHDSIPDNFGFDVPFYWNEDWTGIDKAGYVLNADYCVIDNQDHFIRTTLEIPVEGKEKPFVFGVWSTLSAKNTAREADMADNPDRVHEPPYFGWFANRIWQYPDTLNLKCNVISRAAGLRPCIELQETDLPLALDQRNGIAYERFLELSAQCLHGWKHPESGV